MNEKTFFGFKTGPKGLFNVANLFTVLRIPLGICGIVLYEGGNEAVGILVLVVAALTDLADGQVARRSGCASQFGAILDPTVAQEGRTDHDRHERQVGYLLESPGCTDVYRCQQW